MPYADARLPRRVRRQVSVLLALVLTSAALVVLSAGRADAAPNPNEYVAVAAGGVQTSEGAHALGLTRDGRVMAWGWNIVGQLGDGTTVDRVRPVEVQGLPEDDPVVQIAAGAAHSMALTASGKVYAWGSNSNGQLGIGSFTDSSVPVLATSWRTGLSATGTVDSLNGGTLETLPPIAQISVGASTSYAVGNDGYAYSWGHSSMGEMGIGVDAWNSLNQQDRHLPRRMSTALRTPLTGVAEVEGGDNFVLVRHTDGSVWFAGENTSGEAGDGTSGQQARRSFLTRITALDGKGIVDVTGGATTGYARTNSGQVYSWGSFSEGQTCRASIDPYNPRLIGGLSGTARVVAGYRNVVFLHEDGTARGCGTNVRSGLTLPAEVDYLQSLTRLPNLDDTQALDLSYLYGVAAGPTGDLLAWGYNHTGQVGNGTTIAVPFPMEVAGVTGATQVTAGAADSFAIVAGGQVMAWGQNKYGSLGIGTTTSTHTPTLVDGLSGIVQVSSGMPNQTETTFDPPPDTANQHHTLALTGDGEVYAWGANHYRQLGDGSTTDRTTPVLVQVPGTVVQVVAGGTHSLALNDDGEVYAWGYSNRGQVGTGVQGNFVTVATPTKLDLPANVVEIGAGAIDSFARTASGVVYGWGYNSQGQAGTGGDISCLDEPGQCRVTVPTPVIQTYEGTSWTAASLAIGADFGVAVASGDGEVYGWGRTFSGAYYKTTNKRAYSVPRPADSINPVAPFTKLSGGGGHMLGLRADGEVYGWGGNYYNQVGSAAERRAGETAAVTIALPATASDVSAGDRHSLAVVGGKVYGWGFTGKGALGVDWGPEVRTVQTIAVPGRLRTVATNGAEAQHYRRADQTLFVNPARSGSLTLRYGLDDTVVTGVSFPSFGSGWTGGGAGTKSGDWYERGYTFAAGAATGTRTITATNGGATVQTTDLTVLADAAPPVGGGIGYPASTTSPFVSIRVDPAVDTGSGIAGVSVEARRTTLTASGCDAGSWTSWATEVAAAAASNTRLIDEATCYQYRAVYRDRVGNTRMRTGPTLVSDARLAFGLDQPASPASGTVTLAGFARQQFHTISTARLTWNGPGSTTGTICENPPLALSTGAFTCAWDTTALPDGAYTVGIYAASDVSGGSTSRSVTIQNGNQPPKQPPAPDKTAPVITIAKPKCKPALKGKKCKTWLAGAKAWRTVTGTAVDRTAVAKVEVLAYAKVGKKKFKTLSGRKLKTVKTKALATRTPVAARIVPGGWTISLPKLPRGKWTIQVRATDSAGNVSGWVTLKAKIKKR